MIPGGRGSYTPQVTPRPTAIAALATGAFLATFALLVSSASARTPAGTVLVRSTTVGAEVWIDDQLIGEVPMEYPLQVRSGEHTVKVTKPGHADHIDTFTLKRGQDLVLEIDLLATVGVLRVAHPEAVPPESEVIVFIDGQAVGQTPFEGEVEPGEPVVEVRARGYHPHQESLDVLPGEVYEITPVVLPGAGAQAAAAAEESTPWYGRWWVWAGAAAVVVGATTAAIVASQPDEDPPPDLSVSIEMAR